MFFVIFKPQYLCACLSVVFSRFTRCKAKLSWWCVSCSILVKNVSYWTHFVRYIVFYLFFIISLHFSFSSEFEHRCSQPTCVTFLHCRLVLIPTPFLPCIALRISSHDTYSVCQSFELQRLLLLQFKLCSPLVCMFPSLCYNHLYYIIHFLFHTRFFWYISPVLYYYFFTS